MPLTKTDEEIITSYKDGNKESFKILLNRYSSSIYNFSARLTNKNDATDITQEVFIKTWKNLKHFDETKASFKTWIFVIAKNTITDFLRKKKSLLFSDLDNEEESFADKIPDENLLPNEILEKIQNTEVLNKTLDKIPLNYKTILTLHYQEDLTFYEIGEILNKSLNTVKSWHQRALILLKNTLS